MKSYLLAFALAGAMGHEDDARAIIERPIEQINKSLETLRMSLSRADMPILIACLRGYLQALESVEVKQGLSAADDLQKLIGAMTIRTRKEVDGNE